MNGRIRSSIVALCAIGATVGSVRGNVIFDDFENGDLSTGGAGTTNAGFIKATSGGTAAEANGYASITATSKNTTYGLASIRSFNALADAATGFTAQWFVPSLPAELGANWGTLTFTLQSGSGLFEQTNALSFAIKYQTGGSLFSVNAHKGGSTTSLVSEIEAASANPGFTLTATVREAGWAIDSADLNVHLSGAWPAGHAYADLFDGSTYIGGFINRGGVATARELRLSQVTVIGPPETTTPPVVAHYRWAMEDSAVEGGAEMALYNSIAFVPGKIGNSLQLKTTDDPIRALGYAITPDIALDPSGNYTLAFWMHPGAYSESNACVVSKRDSLDQFQLVLGADTGSRRLSATVWDATGTQSATVTASATLPMNRWSHVALRVDNAGGTLKIFINGVESDGTSLAFDPATATDALVFGRFPSDVGQGGLPVYFRSYNGGYDDVRLYAGAALEPSAIHALASEDPEPDHNWRFDDDAKDAMGYRHATRHGDWTQVQGRIGPGALKLNGATGHAQATNVTFGSSGSYTLTGWIHPSAYPSADAVIAAKRDAADQMQLVLQSSAKLQARVWGAGTNALISSAASIPLNEWTHVALVVDAGNGTFRLFVDGQPDSAIPCAFAPNLASDTFRMGCSHAGTGFFAGMLDDFRIYSDKALAQGQIAAAMAVPELPEPVAAPIQYTPYYRSERRSYAYQPAMIPGTVSFDSMNRPYCRSDTFVQTLDENNQWVRFSFTDAVHAAYPGWDGKFEERTHGEDRVVFDDGDWAYTAVKTSGETTHPVLKNGIVVLYSTDHCRTWKVLYLNGAVADLMWEKQRPHNSLSRPPALLHCKNGPTQEGLPWGRLRPLTLSLFKKNGSDLLLEKAVSVADDSSGIVTHSGSAQRIVTRNNLTHIVYGTVTAEDGNPGVPIYVRTLDRTSNTWVGSPVRLGFAGDTIDGHNTGAMAIDSQGHLHVVTAGHNDRELKYYRSTYPDSTAAWEPEVLIDQGTTADLHTYPSLVCDPLDGLHLTTRWNKSGTWVGLMHIGKPAGGSWRPIDPLVKPFGKSYHNWRQKLNIDRLGNIYLNYAYEYRVLDRETYDAHLREWPEDTLKNYRRPEVGEYIGYADANLPNVDPAFLVLKAGTTNWVLGTGADLVEMASPFQAWRGAHFDAQQFANPGISGAEADPDANGVPNLMEYALGRDPWAGTRDGLPVPEPAGTNFNIVFTRMKAATDITYHVRQSPSLRDWDAIWNSQAHPYGGGAEPSEQVSVGIPLTDTNGFLRLDVTRP